MLKLLWRGGGVTAEGKLADCSMLAGAHYVKMRSPASVLTAVRLDGQAVHPPPLQVAAALPFWRQKG